MSHPRNVPPEVATRRAQVAGLVRAGAAPVRVEAARAELKTARLEDAIRTAVAAAPSLSAEQRLRLARLLT